MTGLVFHDILLYDRSDDAVLRVLADAEPSKGSILAALAATCERIDPSMEPLAGRATRLMKTAFEEAAQLPEHAPIDDPGSKVGLVYDRKLAPLSGADTERWLDDLIATSAASWRDVQLKITAAGMFATFSPGGWLVFGQLARLLDEICGPLPLTEEDAAFRAQFPAVAAWIADSSRPAFDAWIQELLDLEGLASKVKVDLQISAAA